MHSESPGKRRTATRLRLLRLAARTLQPGRPRPAHSLRRVLLLRPDHIGDVLLTAPAVSLLRSSLPNAQLTYLVGPWSAEAARRGPRVDCLRTVAFPGFTRRPKANPLQPYAILLRESVRLRHEGFDLAVVFRPDHWWGALLALVSRIPLRVGGSTPETAPLVTHVYRSQRLEHASDQAMGLARLALAAVGVTAVQLGADEQPPAFAVSDTVRATARDLWARFGLDGRAVVAIQPSAGAPLKSWPVSSWARLADSLVEQGRSVLLVGAPIDAPLLSAIQRQMAHAAASACGQALEVSAAIYERCALLATVDGGAGHLAAVVGTPTVRLYGPAPPALFGPWPRRADQRVLISERLHCVPCGRLELPPCGARELPACMLALTVSDVLNAINSQLDQG